MEVVIVKDGPLTKELDDVIEKYQKDLPMNVIALRENVQLGRALQAGLKACKGEIVARMDSDDIATKDRLRLQYAFYVPTTRFRRWVLILQNLFMKVNIFALSICPQRMKIYFLMEN